MTAALTPIKPRPLNPVDDPPGCVRALKHVDYFVLRHAHILKWEPEYETVLVLTDNFETRVLSPEVWSVTAELPSPIDDLRAENERLKREIVELELMATGLKSFISLNRIDAAIESGRDQSPCPFSERDAEICEHAAKVIREMIAGPTR